MPVETSTTEAVCILDDDLSILRAIVRLLVAEDIKVRGFSDPAEFLAFVQIHSIPVAILDVWMCGMTGLEVQFKLTRVSRQTQVIIMTGRDDSGVKQTAKEMGAIAFFIKPFDDEELISAIRRALEANRPGNSNP